ncbi:unnamed protein product [Amoebophrya sp. A120]|nr:unnamed protein product [Amoebophrya sp. A120]|eukprot:GSA120T00020677001.1
MRWRDVALRRRRRHPPAPPSCRQFCSISAASVAPSADSYPAPPVRPPPRGFPTAPPPYSYGGPPANKTAHRQNNDKTASTPTPPTTSNSHAATKLALHTLSALRKTGKRDVEKTRIACQTLSANLRCLSGGEVQTVCSFLARNNVAVPDGAFFVLQVLQDDCNILPAFPDFALCNVLNAAVRLKLHKTTRTLQDEPPHEPLHQNQDEAVGCRTRRGQEHHSPPNREADTDQRKSQQELALHCRNVTKPAGISELLRLMDRKLDFPTLSVTDLAVLVFALGKLELPTTVPATSRACAEPVPVRRSRGLLQQDDKNSDNYNSTEITLVNILASLWQKSAIAILNQSCIPVESCGIILNSYSAIPTAILLVSSTTTRASLSLSPSTLPNLRDALFDHIAKQILTAKQDSLAQYPSTVTLAMNAFTRIAKVDYTGRIEDAHVPTKTSQEEDGEERKLLVPDAAAAQLEGGKTSSTVSLNTGRVLQVLANVLCTVMKNKADHEAVASPGADASSAGRTSSRTSCTTTTSSATSSRTGGSLRHGSDVHKPKDRRAHKNSKLLLINLGQAVHSLAKCEVFHSELLHLVEEKLLTHLTATSAGELHDYQSQTQQNAEEKDNTLGVKETANFLWSFHKLRSGGDALFAKLFLKFHSLEENWDPQSVAQAIDVWSRRNCGNGTTSSTSSSRGGQFIRACAEHAGSGGTSEEGVGGVVCNANLHRGEHQDQLEASFWTYCENHIEEFNAVAGLQAVTGLLTLKKNTTTRTTSGHHPAMAEENRNKSALVLTTLVTAVLEKSAGMKLVSSSGCNDVEQIEGASPLRFLEYNLLKGFIEVYGAEKLVGVVAETGNKATTTSARGCNASSSAHLYLFTHLTSATARAHAAYVWKMMEGSCGNDNEFI